MKTLAKYHSGNHCVIGEKNHLIYLSGTVRYRDFGETGPEGFSPGSLIFLPPQKPTFSKFEFNL